jgi:lipid-A-disaccharide synthase
MRVFFSTGEPSGEYHAVELAKAMRRLGNADFRFEGIGSERMRAAGFNVVVETKGWASLGPIEAAAKVPRLLLTMLLLATWLRFRPPTLIVFVDFGAFNLRFARHLRRIGYPGPIVYYIPPGAWLDRVPQARMVAAATTPITVFAHQRDFYARLGLRTEFFGHPLASLVPARPKRNAPPSDGGTIALLPGSRHAEIGRHMPPLLSAARLLVRERPALELVISAATMELRARIETYFAGAHDLRVRIVDGAFAALADADAAWIASGTAVLEAALLGVPSVLLYITSAAQARIGRRVYARVGGRWIGLPNLVLERLVIPELWQEAATPAALAEEMRKILSDPAAQLQELSGLRAALGPPDALERIARFVLDCARLK